MDCLRTERGKGGVGDIGKEEMAWREGNQSIEEGGDPFFGGRRRTLKPGGRIGVEKRNRNGGWKLGGLTDHRTWTRAILTKEGRPT